MKKTPSPLKQKQMNKKEWVIVIDYTKNRTMSENIKIWITFAKAIAQLNLN